MQEKLTRREKEIFDLLLGNNSAKEIANTLNISYDTVLSHQKRLYRKLNVHSIDELIEKHRIDNSKNPLFPVEADKKGISLPKLVIPAGVAIIAVSLLLFALLFGKRFFSEKPAVPNPIIITLEANPPYDWLYTLEPDLFVYNNEIRASPFKLGKGNRLTEGDVYTINCTFTSNIDIASLGFCFRDETVEDERGHSTMLCQYKTAQRNIKANVEYNCSAVMRIMKTANNLSERANLLNITSAPYTLNQPTLTFTKLEIVKN